jgi:hypothetical protein
MRWLDLPRLQLLPLQAYRDYPALTSAFFQRVQGQKPDQDYLNPGNFNFLHICDTPTPLNTLEMPLSLALVDVEC